MRKCAYVSDIDRTLIFSTSFFNEYPCSKKLVEVEKFKNGFSYMTEEGNEALLLFARKNTFIPVTSRTLEQYQRINFGFEPKYAITSMGGVILEDGRPMEEWTKNMLSKVNLAEKDSIEKWLKDKGYEPRFQDGCFFFFKTEDTDFSDITQKHPNWRLICQNKKRYIVPEHISKMKAINYLMDYLKIDFIGASGDSMLDMDMLKGANVAVVPDTAYIKNEAESKGFKIAPGGAASVVNTIAFIQKKFSENS